MLIVGSGGSQLCKWKDRDKIAARDEQHDSSCKQKEERQTAQGGTMC